MNEKNLNVFIDFGSSKVRLGIFNTCTDLDIEESNGIPRSTVAHIRHKLIAQIKNLIYNDQDIFIELCKQIRDII